MPASCQAARTAAACAAEVASAMPQSPPPAPDGLAAAPTRCAARTSVASAGVTSGRSSSSPSRASSEAERSSASSSVAASPRATASAAAVATAVRSASAAGRGRGREADEQRRRVCRRAGPARDEVQAGGQRARVHREAGGLAPRLDQAAVHGGGDVGAAALARLEERVRLQRAREQLGARRLRRERGRRRHQRGGAAPEPELPLADQEGARVDDDAQRARAARPAGASPPAPRPASPPGNGPSAAAIHPVGAALGERLHDDAVVARLDRDLDVTVDGRDERGRAAQHGPLAGQEELARRARRVVTPTPRSRAPRRRCRAHTSARAPRRARRRARRRSAAHRPDGTAPSPGGPRRW